MIKSKFITSIFQKFLINRDIRKFKKSLIYYFLFRAIRNFLSKNIILNIYNFKVYGSTNKNKTSYFLLKKCEFGDYHELNTIKKISNKNKILFLDCGCNYGFYSLYVASLSKKNKIISVEASKKTLEEFSKNLNLNNLPRNSNLENGKMQLLKPMSTRNLQHQLRIVAQDVNQESDQTSG